MKTTALCDFLHDGKNYKKGDPVEAYGSRLTALAAAGLVEAVEEEQPTDENPLTPAAPPQEQETEQPAERLETVTAPEKPKAKGKPKGG